MTPPSQPNDELDKAIEQFSGWIDHLDTCVCSNCIVLRAAKRSKELEKENAELEVKLQDQYHINDQLRTAYKQALEVPSLLVAWSNRWPSTKHFSEQDRGFCERELKEIERIASNVVSADSAIETKGEV